MPPLRVLGRHSSSNVQKVLWTLTALNIPFAREDYGGKYGRNHTAEYKALNPNGTVPTLIDGDFVLWESNTICRYLVNRAGGGSFYPLGPRERALCERWMDWNLGTLQPAMVPLYVMMVRTPEAQRDPAAIVKLREKCREVFAVLDAAVHDGGFLSGPHPTLADVATGPWVHRWFALGFADTAQPRLAAWYERLQKEPGFRDGVMAAALE